MNNGPEASSGVSENTAGDLALLEPHLLHVTLDYGEPSVWGVTGAVEGPDELADVSSPSGLLPGKFDIYTAGAIPVKESALHIHHHQFPALVPPPSRYTVGEQVTGRH